MMASFEKFVDQFTANFNAEEFDPEQFKAAFLAAHQDEVSLRDAKIEKVSGELRIAGEELQARKAELYDQLMNSGPRVDSVPSRNTPAPATPEDDGTSELFAFLNQHNHK